MEATLTDHFDPPPRGGVPVLPGRVTLADGMVRDLAGLGPHELLALQWDQERTFREKILDAPKGSALRAEAVRHAYDTVTAIFAAVTGAFGRPLVMGLHPRYERMIQYLLRRQSNSGMHARFFEIGYGCGLLLKQVSDWGFPAAGIDVSPAMHEQARRLLGPNAAVDLYVGDLLASEFAATEPRCTLAYWNDVFEHVPPDEILDYLRRIHSLLAPGGQLVTITPNWHMRPSDVTRAVSPPRTEAAGLHLKEYTLREVTRLLGEAGFARVATPLVVTPRRALVWGRGLMRVKCLIEPGLERLPFRAARALCRGLGLCETIATKA